ncbi:SusD/RagB family nutrient-binding outer membrane lipoprotein [Chitinophaga sp. NPDC101104]|uniref:SusD/RagB family nutrient-binding outer membrane lipoprotein n=1 Tax=Chitinophaga sp. NPDC101104 TaxID=3390561 RepID=UPI003D08BB30
MKRHFNKISISLLLSILFTAESCKDFGDLNKSPNASESPVTSALLTGVQVYLGSGNSMNVNYAFDVRFLNEGAMYVQYTSQTQYPDESQYSVTARGWSQYFAGPLEDLHKIIQYNTDADKKNEPTVTSGGSNANQLAVARILKAYFFAQVTDLWGDVPYKEALSGMVTPKYDTQKDIYTDLLKELKEAIGQFDGGANVKGDILFEGDPAKWKRFANSLRMILALRLSKRDGEIGNLGKTTFAETLASPAGLIDQNSENAIMPWPGGSYKNPWYQMYDGRTDYAISATMADTLKKYADPRASKYGEPHSGVVKGVPYGLTRELLITWTAANPDFSKIGPEITAENAPDYIITAAQILLSRAEAASMGWTAENAQTLYNEAIKASWEQWGVFEQTAYDNYIADAKVSFAGGEVIRKIGTQKWIALYPSSWQGWAEWRRIGWPFIKPTPYAVNVSKKIPRRYGYPTNEITLNKANYGEAAARISGGDTHDGRVWWDKQ